MQIYFSPEFLKEDAQVLNIVDDNNKPVGYMAFLMEQKKMYVYGQLEDEGVSEDFKDLVKPYLQGLTKLKPDLEVYSYLSVGGTKVQLDNEDDNTK
ncbi:hypothetical protein NC797_17225 [Aquibacillus sp. 3ASR75-11]|uniref:Uncharacterized protein n=1 Tax=Terrihalobacillus insolitus TaxID=2950438 RepID=A0A9X3WZJ6_9BACI|nr:hypothetical protein [Terrihalobacillus insolitus]MDC3415223.1 hypothetical protein [Terrihalobacillus insolitus]MDC3426239.1 hypothetical protein [Terrihalobacillus insolitus]